MDLKLVKLGLEYTQKRKKWVLLAAALGFSGYSVYRVYQLPSMVKKRKRLLKFLSAVASIVEVMADSAEAVGLVSKDLKEFIQSNSDQIPNSLRQISKLSRSDEFSESVVGITRALTVGVLRGYRSEMKIGDSGSVSFSDKALDKLFSTAGSGFASVVIGSFARNMVMAFYSDTEQVKGSDLNGSTSADSVSRWVDIISENKCRELIGDCIQSFISTAVAVYLDKTMDINPYDELLSGLTNPKHEEKAREMLALVCNGAIETLVRTSHQVLTSSKSNANSDTSPSYLAIGLGQTRSSIKKVLGGTESMLSGLRSRKSFDKNQGNGWVSKMSSTLAVPSNRRFVLDVTGRVTFETVRSFLEFLLDQIAEGLKRSVNVVHEEVVERGIEVYRYMTTKSSTVVTICLSLCLHILSGPWLLVPP